MQCSNKPHAPTNPTLPTVRFVFCDNTHVTLVCRYAYVEFSDKDSINTAVALNDSLFKGRQIKASAWFRAGQ